MAAVPGAALKRGSGWIPTTPVRSYGKTVILMCHLLL